MKGASSYRKDSQGKKLREAVLQISRGNTSNERELSHSEENGKHRVTLKVKIRGDLLRGLLREDFSEAAVDGLSLVSRAQRREQWEKEVGDTLLEVISTFPVSQYIKGKITVVTPPQSITNIYQYLKLMRLEKQNQYIDTERGGFANMYILTSDYYFNAYRITPNAFIRLVEGLFVEKSGRLTGCVVTKAELNIDFLTAQKQNSYVFF